MDNIIRDSSTTHLPEGEQTSSSANSHDADLGTYWSVYYWERSHGNKNVNHYLTHTFSSPQTIKKMAWKLNVHAQTWAGASYNGAGVGVWIHLYYGGSWNQILGESGSGQGWWSWGYSQNGNYVENDNSGAGWQNVEKVRIQIWSYVERRDEGAGGGNEESYGYTYELEAWSERGGFATII